MQSTFRQKPLLSSRSQLNKFSNFKHSRAGETFQVIANPENIQIDRNAISHKELFDGLLQLWNLKNIPEIHQKYFYHILLTNQQNQVGLIQREIDDIKSGSTYIQNLRDLSIARDRCLTEALRCTMKKSITEFVNQMSRFIYDLRKLTRHLIVQYQKWSNQLLSIQKNNYRWIIGNTNYILKMKEDHQEIKQKHPILMKYFHFSEGEDVFFSAIINQAINSDTVYYDYLKIHVLQQADLARIHELQTYVRLLFDENSTRPIPLETRTNFLDQKSQQIFPSKLHSPSNSVIFNDPSHQPSSPPQAQEEEWHPNYLQTQLYSEHGITFKLTTWDFREIKQVMQYFGEKAVKEYRITFAHAFEQVQQILAYGLEGALLSVNNDGLLLVSLNTESSCRTWVVHMILHNDVSQFYQIVENFVLMLQKLGDKIQEIQVNLAVDRTNQDYKPFKDALLAHSYKYIKSIFDKSRDLSYNVYSYNKFLPNPNASQRPFFHQVVFAFYRTFSLKYKPKFYADEELMEAQMAANLGKSALIQFGDDHTQLSLPLKKNKLYGQQFTSVQKAEDMQKFVKGFNSKVETKPVQLQQFSISLSFISFSSEVHRETQRPFLRIVAGDYRENGEFQILEMSNQTDSKKLYLIPTIDPVIKIFVYQCTPDQVTQNLKPLVKTIFEKHDSKAEQKASIWLPFFSAKGEKLAIQDAVHNGYFTGVTSFALQHPRLGLNSFNHLPDHEVVLQAPFMIGIVQQDLDKDINKPLFTLLVHEENLITNLPAAAPAKKVDQQSELSVVQINPNQIAEKIRDVLAFSCIEVQQSFVSDPRILSEYLKFKQEACLLQLYNKHLLKGFALIYIDQDHLKERRWNLELISVKELGFFAIILAYVTDLIFATDPCAHEIHIGQLHYKHGDGSFQVNKTLADGIKAAGFKWRLVDNDSKLHTRRTIYFLKRPAIYPPKAELVHSIQLDSYYAIWASERRNYPESQLTFLKRGESYSFIEEIFQYKMGNNIEGDPFLLSKIQQAEGKLANTTFEHFGDLEKLRSKFADFKEYPNINESHDRIYASITDIRLNFRKSRPVALDNTPYIELPMSPALFMSSSKENKLNIYFVQLQNPLYYLFVAELKLKGQQKEVTGDFLKYTTIVAQEFENKKNVGWDLLIPTLDTHEKKNESSNWCSMNFSSAYYQTLEQQLVKDKGTRHNVLTFPLFVGLIEENALKQYERPLFAYVAV